MDTLVKGKCDVSLKAVFEGRKENKTFAPSSIIVSEDSILGTDEVNNQIFRLNKSFDSFESFGNQGTGTGEFWYPSAITESPEGHIFVADRWNHRIQVFDSELNCQSQFGSYGAKSGQLNEPMGLAFGSGLLYVADRSNGRIQAFNEEGKVFFSFKNDAPNPRFFESKAFQSNEHYKRWLRNCSRFNSMEMQFSEDGFKTGVMEYPEKLSFTSDGDLIVVDLINRQGLSFSTDLNFKKQFLFIGPNQKEFLFSGCFFDRETDTLWFSSDLEDRSFLCAQKGEKVTFFELEGIRISSFFVSRSDLFIADFWNGKIFHFLMEK